MFCPQTDLCAKDLRPKSTIPHSVSNSGKAKKKKREGFSSWSNMKKNTSGRNSENRLSNTLSPWEAVQTFLQGEPYNSL